MSESSRKSFGTKTPIGRPGQPVEVATCFVFLASADSSYMRYDILRIRAIKCAAYLRPLPGNSGQVLHPNGGTVIA